MSQNHNHLNHATRSTARRCYLGKIRRRLGTVFHELAWARAYFVSTVGRNEEMICAYIRNQEIADKQLDQLQLKLSSS